MKRTSSGTRVLALAAGLSLAPLPLAAQSVLQRTPNLSGGWVGAAGTVYFTFVHRFFEIEIADGEDRVSNSPTFLLGYSFADLFLLGGQYTSSSRTVPNNPNEWEALLRFAPLQPSADLPLELSLTGAYNEAAKSLDGEVAVGLPLGPATFMGSFRAFSNAFGAEEGRIALGAGVRLRLRDGVALAGDYISPTDRANGESYGWAAALQLAIPSTPHTLSLQATNTSTATLQGSSRAEVRRLENGTFDPIGTRYGFEFTVPITLSRYFGGGGPSARDRTITADTVRVAIRDFQFEVQRLTVRPGTTVIWVNEGNVPHSSSSDTDVWDSGLLARGESYARVFSESGEFPYHCEPHAFMMAAVVVQP